ncbi:twin-arginine translocation signal domain-containing protein, partial [Ralstonia condita]|uniref:twin-arginine translocation signal domain-containing protein n=1 Tax=Ralstonia condita TaxID=3058600 RepID=UPI002930D0B1
MHRRDLLKQLAAGLLALAPGLSRSATPGAPEPFDESYLLARARALAARPLTPPTHPQPGRRPTPRREAHHS